MESGRAGPVGIADDARPRRPEAIRFEPLDDGCALFNARTGQVHILNLTAACIWTGCDGDRTLGELIEEIRRTLPGGAASAPDVDRDLRSVVSNLLRAGLLCLERPSSDVPRPGSEIP